MSFFVTLLAVAGLSPLQVGTSGWAVHPREGDRGEMLTFVSGEKVTYRFECAAGEMVVTQTGVTKLIDLKTGKQIGDGPDSVMPSGAAMMAVFGGRGEPQFHPAEAARNPAGGWDLTIRLPKDDKQLKAIGKSEMVSLFTTGYTMAVPMHGGDRAVWNGFLNRCRTPR